MDRAPLRYPEKPCRVMVVDDAIDALLRIATLQPDVVVLDAFMPGVDGLEACRRLTSSSSTRDMKVILTSAAMTPDLERAAIAAGADRVMATPLDLRALLPRAQVQRDPIGELAPAMRGADLLVAMLADAGVDVVFGL